MPKAKHQHTHQRRSGNTTHYPHRKHQTLYKRNHPQHDTQHRTTAPATEGGDERQQPPAEVKSKHLPQSPARPPHVPTPTRPPADVCVCPCAHSPGRLSHWSECKEPQIATLACVNICCFQPSMMTVAFIPFSVNIHSLKASFVQRRTCA
jgi:hypothetical protein